MYIPSVCIKEFVYLLKRAYLYTYLNVFLFVFVIMVKCKSFFIGIKFIMLFVDVNLYCGYVGIWVGVNMSVCQCNC